MKIIKSYYLHVVSDCVSYQEKIQSSHNRSWPTQTLDLMVQLKTGCFFSRYVKGQQTMLSSIAIEMGYKSLLHYRF